MYILCSTLNLVHPPFKINDIDVMENDMNFVVIHGLKLKGGCMHKTYIRSTSNLVHPPFTETG